jgi:hypothetical protein
MDQGNRVAVKYADMSGSLQKSRQFHDLITVSGSIVAARQDGTMVTTV